MQISTAEGPSAVLCKEGKTRMGGEGGTRMEERRVNRKRNRDREREKRGGKREGEGGGREREEEA